MKWAVMAPNGDALFVDFDDYEAALNFRNMFPGVMDAWMVVPECEIWEVTPA